jgi:tetratricopeptide (TPR) repeat protein/tRNA A-37 threonylcarbamoyl transferase component Bud32
MRKLANRYEVLGELGRGGMASVHRAHDHVLGRDVALKIVRMAGDADDLAERLAREARLVAQLDHPNIVPVFDFHRDGSALFYVMPLVEGLTLEDVLQDGPMSADVVTPIIEQVAAALAYSHVRGVVHRDIKPANILLGSGDEGAQRVRLTDFGIAIAQGRGRITASGMIVGTPSYLSPEQVSGETIDQRTDVYMLGAVAYECVTGQLPIEGVGVEALKRILHERPRPPSKRCDGVPEELEHLLMTCLEKDPHDRPQSASEFGHQLRAMRLAGHQRRARVALRSSTRRRVDGSSDTQYARMPGGPDLSAWVLAAVDARSEQEALGDRLLMEGHYHAAREAFVAAQAARQASATASETTEAEHTLRLANVSHKLGCYDEVLGHVHNGLAALFDHGSGGEGIPMLAARLAASAGLACTSAGRFDDAADWIGQALDHLAEAGSDDPSRPFVEAMVRRTQGNMLVGRGRPREAIDVYAQSLALLDDQQDPWEHSIGLYNLGEACTGAGQYERAKVHLDEAFAAKSTIGDRWGMAYVHAMRAQIQLDWDDVDGALSEATAGLKLSLAIADPKLCAITGTLTACAHLRRDALERAEQMLEIALDDATRCGAIPEVIEAHRWLAELSLMRGELDVAADSARVALDLSAGAGSRTARGSAMLTLGRVDLAAGRYDEANKRLERAAQIAASGGNPYRQREIERARRQLANAPAATS